MNVIGWINGSRSPARYLVMTAHYDHLGVRGGQVFNGADDNASGTGGALRAGEVLQREPARAFADFRRARRRGGRASWRRRRSSSQPPVEAPALVLNLNMDMIGRDPNNLLYVSGTHQLTFLKPYIERVAAKAPVKLVMGHDDPAQRDLENWTGLLRSLPVLSGEESRASTSASRTSTSITRPPTTTRR